MQTSCDPYSLLVIPIRLSSLTKYKNKHKTIKCKKKKSIRGKKVTAVIHHRGSYCIQCTISCINNAVVTFPKLAHMSGEPRRF